MNHQLRRGLKASLRPYVCHASHLDQALDGVLQYLVENADEWAASLSEDWEKSGFFLNGSIPRSLLAVLRNPGSQS